MRSSRSRRAFAWWCVPYLLLTVLADFGHAHPLLNPGLTLGIAHHGPSVAADRRHRVPDTSCAICQLQRVRSRVQTRTTGTARPLAEPTVVLAIRDAVPSSPVLHPSTFRGPPSTL
jgi:hypothetical protein